MKKENKKKIFSNKKIKEKTYNMSEESEKSEVKAILSDPRFAHIASDPRYRNISNKATKIQIDRRFKDALKNERFNVKPTLDPRGRPRSYGTKEGLDKFYDLKSSEDESDEESKASDSNEEDEDDSDTDSGTDNSKSPEKGTKSKKIDSKERENFLVSLLDPERDLARGDTVYSDDSSDDDSSTTDEEEEQEKEFNEFEWGELDADAQWDVDGNEVEETNRFAVCDMDWDNMKAVDLFVLFSSFVPTGSCLKKVTIYPSEFGKARMAEEDVSGPLELVKLASSSHKNKKTKDEFSNLEKLKKGILNENDDASTLEYEALRRYQRNRLKYYYAVVECDSTETAKAIYKECDRTYFEVNGVTLDLRYIPADMEFDEVPHDVCEKIPVSYEGENVASTALSHIKPSLTWDETDKRRKIAFRNTMAKALKKKNFDDDILNDFVALSGSDEEEEVDESEMSGNERSDDDEDSNLMEGETKGKKKVDRVCKFRALINEIDEKERKKRENTFTFDEEEAFAAGHERDSEEEVEESEDEEEKSKEGETTEDEFKDLTPFEKMLMKRDKKKKERKLLIKKWKKNKEINNSESDTEGADKLQVISNHQKTSNKKKKNKNKENEEDVPKQSYEDLALLVMDEEQEEKKHFDMLKIKEQKEKLTKKKKRKKTNDNDEEIEEQNDIDFEINTSDSRFAALFTSGDFSMDPSHPKFDKHSSAAQNIMQKQKKMKMNPVSVINNNNNNRKKNSKIDSDISAMIRKIKMKTSKLK